MLENTEGAIKNGHPDKLTTYGPKDEENQNKNTTQYVLDITLRKHTQITYIRHAPSYKVASIMFLKLCRVDLT
jgi:hypothetical protein